MATAESLQDQVTSSAGSYSATAPLISSGNWIIQLAAFKSAAGSGGGTAPHIDQLSPNTGPVGTLVTISGSNFGSSQGAVTFNGTTATIASWSANSISTYVPTGTTSGNVVVSLGSQWSNGVRFNLPQPSVLYIQGNSNAFTSSQSSVTVTYTQAQPQHDLNVVAVGWQGSATIQSITDTQGNTYTQAISTTNSGFGTQTIYYAKNIAAATANQNTVTVTFSSAANAPDVRIAEYQGLDRTNSIDLTSGGQGNGDYTDSGGIITTNNYDLLVGASYTGAADSAPGFLFNLRLTSSNSNLLEDFPVQHIGIYNADGTICPQVHGSCRWWRSAWLLLREGPINRHKWMQDRIKPSRCRQMLRVFLAASSTMGCQQHPDRYLESAKWARNC